jgi:hypothetical protein
VHTHVAVARQTSQENGLLIFHEEPASTERPAGIALVAAIMLAYAFAACAYAALIATGNVAMARGGWVIGGGLEILGPGIFVLYAVVHAACAIGLLRLQRWALRASSLVLLYGLIQVTPAISSAVADGRILAIAREGMQILLRSAALWYLWQEPTRDAFASKVSRR